MKRKLYLAPSFRHTAMLLACGLPVAAGATTPLLPTSALHVLVDIPIAGRVVGSKGEPLPGVTVLVRGTTIGSTTDADGRFALRAPEGSTLLFSFIGYVGQPVLVTSANASNVSVTMREDTQKLNEVVVVGYGTQERGSVTGAISSVNGAELTRQPVPDVTQALQGKVAGVTITSNGGTPGGSAGSSVRVRGITSAGNNSPLYVIDGFPIATSTDGNGNATGNELQGISPDDIETIDVLKDASATAIYGVRAANGVVLITTKHGKAGQSSVNVNAYAGVQTVARRLSLLNAEQYAVINNESRIAAGKPIVVDRLRDPASLGAGTNWQDLVFRRAQIQNYSLGVTGGSDKASYALSASYFQQDGIVIGSNFERYTLRANGEVKIGRLLKVGNNIQLTHLSDRQVTTNSGEYGTIQQLIRIPAIIQPYRSDGYWYEPTGSTDNFIEENPLASAQRNDQRYVQNRILTTFYAELEPFKGLRIRSNVGADLLFSAFNSFAPSAPPFPGVTSRYATAGASATSSYAPSYLIENTATYDKLIADKHQVTFLLGQSAQEFNYSNVEAYRTGYLRNDLRVINAGPINTLLANAGFISSPQHLASYFGRLNYEFAGKYLFSAVARYDGSSVFPPGEKFGFFPGASVGWRISEEEFLKGNRAISNLKIRAGYGRVGNPLNAGRYAYLYSINFGITYPFGPEAQTINTGGAPTRLANPNLRWENNNQANIGLDLGFLDNRIEASIDVYNRNSPNLIAPVPVSYASGTYENVNTNAASAYNRGIDFSLNTRNFIGSNGGFNWSTSVTVSAFKTKLESLGQGVPYNGPGTLAGDPIIRYDAGQPFGSFFGYVADGLFQTADEVTKAAKQENGTAPGDIRFKDLNGDGVINAADRTFIGKPNPNFSFGITNTLNYKGFDLSFFINGAQGNQIYNQNRYLLESALYGSFSGGTITLNRWTGPGTSNDVPRAIDSDPNRNLRVSSHFVEDGSFIRLKNVTFGYTLPQSLLSRVGSKQIRFYVTGQNLLTLTHYTGFDPEVSASGVDLGIYPQARVFTGGVNIGF
ncbi:SusC/RagA family TonB-linked outer membrane protein [Hymenobacter cheonanensis]|uniref:SusC/RagA family TonB-linked outer membrane protein n=1 Tax=Hymenobacter sp. CA2-7 TaxID=3063993 RepID=UPI002712C850|nr:TonB-dependent receptor [Hymenobacter sp. CA2-7]MDO7884011.1 TonB-dependent receptor [Hymenobacter sp. CA2-7]